MSALRCKYSFLVLVCRVLAADRRNGFGSGGGTISAARFTTGGSILLFTGGVEDLSLRAEFECDEIGRFELFNGT